MNILIVTPFYKQDKNIASVRWTNLSARLSKRHNIIVVTQPFDDMDMNISVSKEDNILVARVNQKTGYEKLAVKHFNGATGDDWQTGDMNTGSGPNDTFIRRLKNKVMFASMKRKSKQYASYIVKNVIPKNTKIDVVISSACPFIEMLFGYELKKKLKCKWISDFRDLPFMEDNCDSTHHMKKIMIKQLAYADAIITIANKGKEKLSDGIVKDTNKIHVITNGFSMNDAGETTFINDDVLHIVHTGSLYGGTRKADLFFKAVKEAKSINKNFKYVLECAGGNNESLIKTAEKYDEDKNVKNLGFVPRKDALKMQSEADILIALIFKKIGSFSAKIYEYILNKKPIITISCGDGPIGEETEFIKLLNLGVAVDEYNGEKDISILRDYLLKQYNLKNNNKSLDYRPDYDLINEYNHDKIVQKVNDLCESII